MATTFDRKNPPYPASGYSEFVETTKTLVENDDYHRLGLVPSKSSSLPPLTARWEPPPGGSTKIQTFAEIHKRLFEGDNPWFQSTDRFNFSPDMHEWFTERLATYEVNAFIASNGQMGVFGRTVPETVRTEEVQVEDEVCQFRDSDVTVIFRREFDNDDKPDTKSQ